MFTVSKNLGHFRHLSRNIQSQHRILKISLLTGAMMGIGSVIAQFITREKHDKFNVKSIMQFSLYGFIFAGPIMHNWFTFLNAYFPPITQYRVLKMVCIDQMIMSPLNVALFVTYCYFWNTENVIIQIKKFFFQDFVSILLSSYTIWPIVQFINFCLIPLNRRIIFVNSIALIWNTFLALKVRSNKD
ncbi:hypothetical protein GJ496_009703 [Pomphorhynchus laevis]|nr:hypothetical protein GJ496_009703 [Pomphorhynchus laevis]